jgi:hypothetical protein
MESEEWRQVAAFPGYEVSNLGRVRRGIRIRKATLDSKGYPRVSFWVNGKSRQIPVHKIVAEAFLGPRPPDLVIRHLDGHNNNPASVNLKYGTSLENEADKAAHGTKAVGEKHGACKLTEAQVIEIRRRHVPRHPQHGLNAMAREFGVSVQTIRPIVLRKTWKHI